MGVPPQRPSSCGGRQAVSKEERGFPPETPFGTQPAAASQDEGYGKWAWSGIPTLTLS